MPEARDPGPMPPLYKPDGTPNLDVPDFIRCPTCKGSNVKVAFEQAGADRDATGYCRPCDVTYPIRVPEPSDA